MAKTESIIKPEELVVWYIESRLLPYGEWSIWIDLQDIQAVKATGVEGATFHEDIARHEFVNAPLRKGFFLAEHRLIRAVVTRVRVVEDLRK